MEAQKEKWLKKIELGDMWDNIKQSNVYSVLIPEVCVDGKEGRKKNFA